MLVLFINNRLVSSSQLKRSIKQLYQNYLPKGNHFFVYLSLSLRPSDLDVNVHPNKKEV